MTLLARRRAAAVFLAFAFAFFFAALLRAVTATLSPGLTREFALDASGLGLLAGGYFLGFAATQLPLGNWLDRHGPKRVILGFLVIAAAGCAAFALAHDFAQLLAARVLCGVGVSACLMAPLTGYRRWFDTGVQLRASSWMLMVGALGVMGSTLPVQWLVPVVGWRPLFWGLAAAIVLSMVLIAWIAPAWEARTRHAPAGSYREIWRNPTFRRMAPLAAISYGGMIAIQTLWAGPWMVRVAGYEPLAAAQGLFAINACMLAAFLGWGALNPLLARRGITVARLIAWGVPSSFVMLALLVLLGPRAGAATLALYCVSSTFLSLAQPAVAMVFPAALAGRALTAFNLVIFLGVFAMQWGIGLAIDALRAAGLSEADAFRGALAAFLACSVMAYGYFLSASDNPKQ